MVAETAVPEAEYRNPLSAEFMRRSAAERVEILASLRATRGPVRFRQPSSMGGPPVEFYLVTRYAEVEEASRRTDVFSSEPNATTLEDLPPDKRRGAPSMINMDDPRHARIRRIVARAFTVRTIAAFDHRLQEVARGIVDDLEERGPCDFVADVARPMPLKIICTMMGIPEEAHDEVIEHSETFLAATDPLARPPRDAVAQSVRFFDGLFRDLSRERRSRPTGDLTTLLVHDDADGDALDERELAVFFRSLVVAGTGTTRNSLSHALIQLTDHEDQRELLLADVPGRMPGTVEEVLRHVSPVTYMRRNLTRDYVLGDVEYAKGDMIVMHYGAANRDETVFERPDDFDITRDPNPHLAFGGPGPHLCLGANLARREMTVLLGELFTRLPGLRATGAPVLHETGLVYGVDRLPCAF
ncbi:cytochrome P450 [Actinomadura rupiterrae]|uniref:cytochrome P450 n=1 Tax=Actinomadura rupiterrae TaxID=559627 RepID=UPI0020A3F3A0|nr:cytochrome P450 [Actinomadura rupiterrae]MCP2336087.1 cytochrome P450 [Actinomadura rupiterrae]